MVSLHPTMRYSNEDDDRVIIMYQYLMIGFASLNIIIGFASLNDRVCLVMT